MENVKEQIQQISGTGVPLTHQLLISVLGDYKRPNEKIHDLINEGFIESVKRGIYIPGKTMRAIRPENSLLANYLLGPSYVSMDFALSYHGLIPERVYEISSVTTKSSRKFDTPAGVFTYTQLPLPYYAFGQMMAPLANQLNAIIATPEKALCDKIVTTQGILLRSKASAASYVFEDLRMDESEVKKFDTARMNDWLSSAPKQSSLIMLVKMIEAL